MRHDYLFFATIILSILVLLGCCSFSFAEESKKDVEQCIFYMGKLDPVASTLKVKVGDVAPDFLLPSIAGERVRLSDYRGKKNVALSFIPAAWSAVCSEQWPEYNLTEAVFQEYNTIIIGISVDNIATLYAWSRQRGSFWFPVVSDFWPHGAVAEQYGVLRTDGLAERALFVIDTEGIVRFVDVHDINSLPDFAKLVIALQEVQ